MERSLAEAPWWFLEAATKRPVAFAWAGFDLRVVSVPCPTLERSNQDGVLLLPVDADSCVVGLADGMGGGREAGKAVRITLESLAGQIRAALEQEQPLRSGILNGFETANHQVSELGIGAATTLTVAALHQDAVRVYHVGDSEAAVVGQRGKLKLNTVSHTPAGYGREAGLLSEREAMAHNERHVLLNLIGSPEMRIDLGPRLRLADRDTLVLGSDGLFDNWKLDEILERIRRGPLDRAAQRLHEATVARMTRPPAVTPTKPDDLSFVLVRRGA